MSDAPASSIAASMRQLSMPGIMPPLGLGPQAIRPDGM